MSENFKVQPHHLKQNAYLYIRQSSLRQVIENTESTKRQYALRARAVSLGWSEERIIVIDSDQGESGASSAWREGFRHLVTEVGLGRAGIVMGLEVSRLARNNSDWHRLLEICALTDTLILDEDGVYNPTHFNDRLLLGLKGTMSEAELHVLKARLRGGIINKARRGEYRCILPTGLVYDENGDVILDPDVEIRETIIYFFETFTRVGSACQIAKVFRKENLRFPVRDKRHGDNKVIFRSLTACAAERMLKNPRYAGAYVYGRRQFSRTITGKKTSRSLPFDEWLVCIPDAHAGYISWEQYKENVQILKNNGQGFEMVRKSPPREGPALLQGRAVCGRCGRHFRVKYKARRGRKESRYVCDRASTFRGEPNCQSIVGKPIDEVIGQLIVEMMTPAAIDLAIEIRKEIEAQWSESDQLRCRAIERAEYEADLAQRRYMMVDPANRHVADTLEADWNNKLRALAQAREEREQNQQKHQISINNKIRARLVKMTNNFKQIWTDPTTSNRDRKRMLAFIIEDVTLLKSSKEGTTKIYVRFKGGKTETLKTQNPKSFAQQIKTDPRIVSLVDQLLDNHTYSEIAKILNDRGYRPGGSVRPGCENVCFNAKKVAYLAVNYKLRSRYNRLRSRGMMTVKAMAKRLGIHEHTVIRWGQYGIIKGHAYNDGKYLYEDPGSDPPGKHSSRWDKLVDRAETKQRRTNTQQNQNTALEPKEV